MNPGSNEKGSMSATSSSVSWKPGDIVSEQFPAGLRVLVVDDDPTCLVILEKMLITCLYKVTKCIRAEIALSLLRENKTGYDIVISDVHMPDMDGFKLLEHIGLMMDLPVIMMSADDSKNVVMRGVTHGAVDYLIKPVRIDSIRNIWQHVVRKRKNEWKDLEQSGSVEDGDKHQKAPSEETDHSSSVNESNWKISKKRKDGDDEHEERDETSTIKKQRVVWSVELHQQFVTAVNQLGIDKAVPKKILELMNVPGLTRENVASHLQKYRLYLRRISGASQHPNSIPHPFITSHDAIFGPLSSIHGHDIQTLATTGQFPTQNLSTYQAVGLGRSTMKSSMPISLVDQRNLFTFEHSRLRFGDGQKLGGASRQMNFLHGIPTTMEAKHLASLQHSAQSLRSMNMHHLHVGSHRGPSSPFLIQTTQSLSRAQLLDETNGTQVPTLTRQPILPNAASNGILGRNEISQKVPGYIPITQCSSILNFPMNQTTNLSAGGNFPFGSIPGIPNFQAKSTAQEVVNSEMKGSGVFPTYDIFNETQQQKPCDWGLQNVGMTFNASQHANVMRGNVDLLASIFAQQPFGCDNRNMQDRSSTLSIGRTIFSGNFQGNNDHYNPAQHPNLSEGNFDVSPSVLVQEKFSVDEKGVQNIDPSVTGKAIFSGIDQMNDHMSQQYNNFLPEIKVKSENVSDANSSSAFFSESLGQDELISVIFKQQPHDTEQDENEFDFEGYSMDNIHV